MATALISNAKHLRGSAIWLKFNRVLCEKWFHKNIVLIGDAAHTAHFGIGSGTKLAMEDAMALARVLTESQRRRERSLAALPGRARDRSAQAAERRAQSHGMVRSRWSATSIWTRSSLPIACLPAASASGHENLKLRDSGYVERVETMVRRRAAESTTPSRRCSRRSPCAA